jgi:hypothetical protein
MPTWLPSCSRSREYAQLIYDQTSSPILDKVLKKLWQKSWHLLANDKKKARIRSYSLTNSRHPSAGSNLMFEHFAFEWFVEIDPSPTLTGMATQTLKANYEAQDNSIVSLRKNVLPTAIHYLCAAGFGLKLLVCVFPLVNCFREPM